MPRRMYPLSAKTTVPSIYFDTAPFIYLLEGHPEFSGRVAQIIRQGVVDGVQFSTSTLAVMEFSVKPLQNGRHDVLAAFDGLLRELDFIVQPVTVEIAREAARLRSVYPYLKGLDALHLSTAKSLGSEVFLTNDHQLARVKEIPVKTLADYPATSHSD